VFKLNKYLSISLLLLLLLSSAAVAKPGTGSAQDTNSTFSRFVQTVSEFGSMGRNKKIDSGIKVKSAEDFYLHMRDHIERTKIIAFEILRRFPKEFASISSSPQKRALLFEFLLLHDQSKVNLKREFLLRYKLNKRQNTILEDLYANYYGVNIYEDLTPEARHEAKAFIATLNEVDEKVTINFLKENRLIDDAGNLSLTALEFLRIEKLSDVIDRANSPLSPEEFNKPIISASQWFTEKGDKIIAQSIEPDYMRLTKDHHFYKAPFSKKIINGARKIHIRSRCIRHQLSVFLSTMGAI